MTGRGTCAGRDVTNASTWTRATGRSANAGSADARPRGAGRCAARSGSNCACVRPRGGGTRPGRRCSGPRRRSGGTSRRGRESSAAPARASASTTAAATAAAATTSAAAGEDLELHDEDTQTDDQQDKGNTFHDRTWTRIVS